MPALERFPRSQKFLLGDRIQGTALDVLESLIEATYTRQRGGHLARANLGVEKLRFLLRLAQDLRHLDGAATSTRRAVWTRPDARSARGARRIVPAKEQDLFDGMASFPALHVVARRAARGKRAKPGAAAFLANLEKELLRLERELWCGHYRPGRYKRIEIRDPKHRVVSAAPFRDRVVHHAFCAVCEPIFDRGFIDDSYANRTGKGTHRAVARYEAFRDRFRSVLRCDIDRYFPAIDHEILKRDLRRRIACPRTLALADEIIDGSNHQEPVDLYYPGDDLFTPFQRRRGLPIGNLTSQFFANLYLNGLDHFYKEVLRAKGYLRYVDDFALFHDDVERLQEWRLRIGRYLEGRRLCLHACKTGITATREPAAFLGFVLLAGGYRRLPEDNVRRFRNRLRGLRMRWRQGSVTRDEVVESDQDGNKIPHYTVENVGSDSAYLEIADGSSAAHKYQHLSSGETADSGVGAFLADEGKVVVGYVHTNNGGIFALDTLCSQESGLSDTMSSIDWDQLSEDQINIWYIAPDGKVTVNAGTYAVTCSHRPGYGCGR